MIKNKIAHYHYCVTRPVQEICSYVTEETLSEQESEPFSETSPIFNDKLSFRFHECLTQNPGSVNSIHNNIVTLTTYLF